MKELVAGVCGKLGETFARPIGMSAMVTRVSLSFAERRPVVLDSSVDRSKRAAARPGS
jgi:hypothetical protein